MVIFRVKVGQSCQFVKIVSGDESVSPVIIKIAENGHRLAITRLNGVFARGWIIFC